MIGRPMTHNDHVTMTCIVSCGAFPKFLIVYIFRDRVFHKIKDWPSYENSAAATIPDLFTKVQFWILA